MPPASPLSASLYSSIGESEYDDDDSIQCSIPSPPSPHYTQSCSTTDASQRRYVWAAREAASTVKPILESPFDRYPTVRRKSILKLDDMLEQLSEHISNLDSSADSITETSDNDSFDRVILEELIIDHYLTDDCQDYNEEEFRTDSAISSIQPTISLHTDDLPSRSSSNRVVSRIRRIDRISSISGDRKEYVEVSLVGCDGTSFVSTQFETPSHRLGQEIIRKEEGRQKVAKKRRSFLKRVSGFFGKKVR